MLLKPQMLNETPTCKIGGTVLYMLPPCILSPYPPSLVDAKNPVAKGLDGLSAGNDRGIRAADVRLFSYQPCIVFFLLPVRSTP